MIEKILSTDNADLGAFIARLCLGIVILPHGLQKLIGMFGGYGFTATVEYFASIGIPSFIGGLVVLGESFGALFLILGLISRLAAAGIAIIMLGAVLMVHLKFGFFYELVWCSGGGGV